MRRVLALILAALVAGAPGAQAKTLDEQLNELHFEDVLFTFGWEQESDRATVAIDGLNLHVEGEAAQQLRACIDGQDCVIPELGQAASGSNRDGDVTSDEVESFVGIVKAGIATLQEMKALRDEVKGWIKYDNMAPSTLFFGDVGLDNAEGSITDASTINLDVKLQGSFATVAPADTHQIWVKRAQSEITIADKVTVQAARGWKILEESVEPADMQALFDDGRMRGSQEAFESSTPLTFTLAKDAKKSPGAGLWLGVGAVSLAAILASVVILRRKL